MDLELDDDQRALADAARAVLAREWPVSAVRRLVEEAGDGHGLWKRMVDLDWPGLCIAEPDGGSGYGAVEAAIVLEACGEAVAPGPLLPTTALFAPLLRELGGPVAAETLRAVAAGERTGTAAVSEVARVGTGADADEAALGVGARRERGRWLLAGTARSVVEGGAVDRIAVPAALRDGGIGVFLVEPGRDVIAAPVESVDATRTLVTIRIDDAAVDASAVLGRPGDPMTPRALRRALDEAVTLLAAELVGTCAAILDMTLEHVKTRRQFGEAIGSFQAVKHRLADAHLSLEAARAAMLVAAAAVAEDDDLRSVAASTAKALAGDCAATITREGIQLHGGIGFTWEHDMHLFVKRAMASSALLGTAEVHRQRVADLIGLVPGGAP